MMKFANNSMMLCTIKRFCNDEELLKGLYYNALTFDDDIEQDMTREFLNIFLQCLNNTQLPLNFVNQNRNGIKRFHNSALITDYFKHIPKKNIEK